MEWWLLIDDLVSYLIADFLVTGDLSDNYDSFLVIYIVGYLIDVLDKNSLGLGSLPGVTSLIGVLLSLGVSIFHSLSSFGMYSFSFIPDGLLLLLL